MSGRIVFAIPGDLQARTGGYGFDRRIIEHLPGCGLDVSHCPLSPRFPAPDESDLADAVARINAAARPGDVVLIDGLAYGAMPRARIAAIEAPIIALCHHPLGLEAGLAPARRDALMGLERGALAHARHVVVPSPTVATTLTQAFDVPSSKISVALPGTDPATRARGSGGAPALLAIGSIIPRKAFAILVEALAPLRDRDWRLRIVGSPDRDPDAAAALVRLIARNGLQERVTLKGEIPGAELDRLYDTSDISVSSSLYEGYGMVLAEALARGLPIVTTTGGAAADTVPDAAGLKVPPGDSHALRDAIAIMLNDVTWRSACADAAWAAGQQLPRWRDAAEIIADVARRVSGKIMA